MPLVVFHVFEDRSAVELRALLDAAHAAVVGSFGVPESDRYQIVTTHRPHEMIALDTGLGIDRTAKLVVIEVASRPRTRDEKTSLYRSLVDNLHRECGIDPGDVLVSITENTDADWSFGLGRAQFLTGELGDTEPFQPFANT